MATENDSTIKDTLDVKPKFWSKVGRIASGLLPIGGQLLNTALDYWAQKKNVQRSKSTALELEKYRFDQNKKMYDESLLYNSPKEQMKRFKEAGLNPNLIYSRGSSGEAPNVLPQYGQIHAQTDLPSPVKVPELGRFYEGRLMYNQLQQAEANTTIAQAEAFMKTNQASASIEYIFEEAYTRAKEAGFKGQKADFDKKIMEEFKNEYGSFQAYNWSKASPELQKTQEDAKKAQIDRKQAELMFKYTKQGLPWMIPLNMIFGNLLKLKF